MAPPSDVPGRVRPWRVATLSTSCGLTLAAAAVLLAGLPTGAPPAHGAPEAPARPAGPAELGSDPVGPIGPLMDAIQQAASAAAAPTGHRDLDHPGAGEAPGAPGQSLRIGDVPDTLAPAPPRGSGDGRRVVFDQSAQQVWLVRDAGSVASTYAVSGSRHDNLSPGRYAVSSRSRHAVGFDYRSTMDLMVRFAEGDNAAIGFHDIPVDEQGEPMQRWSQLGTPLSSGCIRQRPRDARELWRFAPIGTPVVVVA